MRKSPFALPRRLTTTPSNTRGSRLGNDALGVGVRLTAFALILLGAALIPAPVRAGEVLAESAVEPGAPTASPTLSRSSEAQPSPQTTAHQQ
jgi:hypothetical protein